MRSFFTILIATLFMSGCKEKEEPQPGLLDIFPQKVILAMEDPNDNLFYEYLAAPGSVVRRVKAEKTDDAIKRLFNSLHAPECVWIAYLDGNFLGFHLAEAPDKYLMVTPNRLSDEYMLSASSKGNDQSHLFKRHQIEFGNGVRIVTLESVMYPGYFLSQEGVIGENNAIKLVERSDAQSASKVRWYAVQM